MILSQYIPHTLILSVHAMQIHEVAHTFTKRFTTKDPKNPGTPCATDLVRSLSITAFVSQLR